MRHRKPIASGEMQDKSESVKQLVHALNTIELPRTKRLKSIFADDGWLTSAEVQKADSALFKPVTSQQIGLDLLRLRQIGVIETKENGGKSLLYRFNHARYDELVNLSADLHDYVFNLK